MADQLDTEVLAYESAISDYDKLLELDVFGDEDRVDGKERMDYEYARALAKSELARTQHELRINADAKETIRQALSEFHSLQKQQPYEPRYFQGIAAARATFGSILVDLYDSNAEKELNDAIRLYEDLVTAFAART